MVDFLGEITRRIDGAHSAVESKGKKTFGVENTIDVIADNYLKKKISEKEREEGVYGALAQLYVDNNVFGQVVDKGTSEKSKQLVGDILYLAARKEGGEDTLKALASGRKREIKNLFWSTLDDSVVERIRNNVISSEEIKKIIDKYEMRDSSSDLTKQVAELEGLKNNLTDNEKNEANMVLTFLSEKIATIIEKNKIDKTVKKEEDGKDVSKEINVKVERSDGRMENDWKFLGMDGDMVVVGKQENGRDIMKKMPMEIFSKLNPDYIEERIRAKSMDHQKEDKIKKITVNVKRSDGRMENDWKVLNMEGDMVVVNKQENGKNVMKKIPMEIFSKLNPDYLDNKTEKNIAVKEEEKKESASLEDLLNTVKQSNESVPEIKEKEDDGKEESVLTLGDLLKTAKGPGNNAEVKMSEEKTNSKIDQLRMMINEGIGSGKKLTEEDVKKFCMENGIKYKMADYENGKFTISSFLTNNILLEDNNEFYIIPSPSLLKPDFYRFFYDREDIENRSLIAMDFIAKIESFTKLVKQGNGYEVEKKGLMITKPDKGNEDYWNKKHKR